MKFHRLCVLFLLGAALAAAQETRGDISGTVVDPQGGLVAGAVVTVTNPDTGVTNQTKTNSSGYYLAALLIPGNYTVTIEAPGFKRSVRSGLVLAVGQHMDLDATLEVGAVSESVTVSGEAPLLDTASVTAGQNLDRRSVEALPTFADMPVLLTRFVPGVFAAGAVQFTNQGYVNRTSDDYDALGAVGNKGKEWTIDGATNNGADQNLHASPNSEMVQEMRVETANFDAAFGHGTGIGVSIMTRGGANEPHGSANWLYWNNRWNSPHLFQRQVYYRNIANARAKGDNAQADALAAKSIMAAGFSKTVNLTIGGPVYIPKVINGKDKLFFFFSFGWNRELRIGANASGIDTVPTMANRTGDFSNLLKLPGALGAQYQIYDPLTVRPDPARAGHYIRTPFGGNILPSTRIVNPMYNFYVKRIPTPNSDPLDPTQEPLNNLRTAGDPDPLTNIIWGNRLDYNLSEKHRFFFRWSYSRFTEGLGDWAWLSEPGLMADGTFRRPISGIVDWTYARSATTIISTQVNASRFAFGGQRIVASQYKPTDVGLPSYVDQRCALSAACTMPTVSWSGYRGLGQTSPFASSTRNNQEIVNVTRVLGEHTLRFGVDFRQAFRIAREPGNAAGAFAFDNTYTRKNDDTSVTPAGNLGLSWAAFALGIPTSASIAVNDTLAAANHYYAAYIAETWRATRALTLNLGLRFEFEDGMTERYDRMLVGWDPEMKLPISDAATAAYAAKPLTELPASSFVVKGGSLYANTQGRGREAWPSAAHVMPRFALAWQLNRRTVLRGGFGMYYDTLNPTGITPNQLGFSQTTTNVSSNDFGMTWNMGNPAAGVSPMADPFPVRADGTRFDAPYRNALGGMMVTGTSFNYANLDREHFRVERWRAGIQRELGSNMAVDVVYTGLHGGNDDLNVKQDVLPEQYWNATLVRNSALASDLNSNVTNPFYINNFQSFKTSDPLLYRRLASTPFFTSPTIQKNRLLRPFSQMTGLTALALPMRKVWVHSLDVGVQRRFSRGFNLNMAFSANRAREWSTIFNEYEKAPTQWLPTNTARPYRVSGNGLYQFPFGKGRAFWQNGILNALAGGWQTAATFEWQPGALLSWGNLFFYGNLDDINTGDRTLARWFNIDAGFEKSPSKVPAAYQKRVFPTLIDGLRQDKLLLLNANVERTFSLKERVRFQVRVDAQNLLNRSHFGAPNLDPTSTQFGAVTQTSGTIMRWYTFIGRITF